MELTGKAKEDFDKWLSNDFELDEQPIKIQTPYEGEFEEYASENFYSLPFSMQFGVYVDFFESVGFEIDITPQYGYFEYLVYWNNNGFVEGRTITKNRKYVRKLVVETFNEKYNNL